jgi:hypothetical protein
MWLIAIVTPLAISIVKMFFVTLSQLLLSAG